MTALELVSAGIQLDGENLAARPARFLSDPHMRTLGSIRAQYGPQGMFWPWW